jgi:hypothetical protein
MRRACTGKNPAIFDYCSFSANATVVEVLSLAYKQYSSGLIGSEESE